MSATNQYLPTLHFAEEVGVEPTRVVNSEQFSRLWPPPIGLPFLYLLFKKCAPQSHGLLYFSYRTQHHNRVLRALFLQYRRDSNSHLLERQSSVIPLDHDTICISTKSRTRTQRLEISCAIQLHHRYNCTLIRI